MGARRLIGLLLKILWRSMTGKSRMPEACDVLFVLSPGDIATPKNGSLISMQLDSLITLVAQQGLRASLVTRPEDNLPDKRTKYTVTPYPVFAPTRVFLHLLKLGMHTLVENLEREVFVRETQSVFFPTWEEILKTTGPRLVIGIGLPDRLCQLAGQIGIRTAEVQHGIFDDLRRHYWASHAPDYFLAWDPSSATKASEAGLRAIVSGHPMSADTSTHSDGKRDPSVCCVALSWGRAGALDNCGSVSPELLEAVEELRSHGFKFVLRPHPVIASLPPVRWSRYLEKITRLIPDAEIRSPMDHDWQDMIRECDFLLTHDSSSAFEFGIAQRPSIVLDREVRANLRSALNSIGGQGWLIGGEISHVWPSMPPQVKDTLQNDSNIERALEILLTN